MDFLHKVTETVNNWRGEDSPSVSQKYGLLLLGGIGALTVAYNLLLFIRVLLSLFVLPGKSIRSFGPKGSWALITGASDGIGKEFALQLARKGYNVFLVSRTQSKLDELADQIKSKYPSVQTKTFAMDFAQNRHADFAELKNEVDKMDIAVLVNNVGKSHSIPVPFLETPEEEMTDIITINCFGTLRVTQIVAPGMVQRKRGLILTLGSFGGLLPTPLLATYSGSKAFLQQWSTALGAELAPHGVTVHLVHAHLIASAMSKIRKPRFNIPSPRDFVQAVLSKIGSRGGTPTYAYSGTPYWSHGIMAWFMTCVLGVYSSIVLGINHNLHKNIRKAALRKAARKNQKSS